jgi:hypothetical protein
MGLDAAWLDSVIEGAAMTYLSPQRDELISTEESDAERAAPPQGPAGRRTTQVNRIIRRTRNVLALQQWYQGKCQVCGNELPGNQGEKCVDYAHVHPLGAPHNGPDTADNMLSLCPNHHRQLDRGGIGIDPGTLAILAPHGSYPAVLPALFTAAGHRMSADCLRHHRDSIFKP